MYKPFSISGMISQDYVDSEVISCSALSVCDEKDLQWHLVVKIKIKLLNESLGFYDCREMFIPFLLTNHI